MRQITIDCPECIDNYQSLLLIKNYEKENKSVNKFYVMGKYVEVSQTDENSYKIELFDFNPSNKKRL